VSDCKIMCILLITENTTGTSHLRDTQSSIW